MSDQGLSIFDEQSGQSGQSGKGSPDDKTQVIPVAPGTSTNQGTSTHQGTPTNHGTPTDQRAPQSGGSVEGLHPHPSRGGSFRQQAHARRSDPAARQLVRRESVFARRQARDERRRSGGIDPGFCS